MYEIISVLNKQRLYKDGVCLGDILGYFVWDNGAAINVLTLTHAANIDRFNCDFECAIKTLQQFDQLRRD